MEVREIFELLSKETKEVLYTSFLYESRAEKFSSIGALLAYLVFIRASFSNTPSLALVAISLSLLSLISYSVISFLKDKDFVLNPIKYYVTQLHKKLDSEAELTTRLSCYSKCSLKRAKSIYEHEYSRINKKIVFIVGAIDKVGLFPSVLALVYALYQFQSASGSVIPSFILVASTMGLYIGVLLLKRITNWQEQCVYILNKAIDKSL